MKIQKGHYVPKELITSDAIHEAVVKCFVAAGFKDKRPEFGNYGECIGAVGLVCSELGNACWTVAGNERDALTLQQLFTAENGLQWPDWAYGIAANDHSVWFYSVGMSRVISGQIAHPPVGGSILATRQPKEKEVNEALDKAVIELNGVWPDFKTCAKHEKIGEFTDTSSSGIIRIKFGEEYIEKQEFTQRAKEPGFTHKPESLRH